MFDIQNTGGHDELPLVRETACVCTVRLRDLAASEWGVIESVLPPLDGVRRLQALGLCQGRVVEVISPGDPMIVRVYETRIALSAQLAGQVMIKPCPPSR